MTRRHCFFLLGTSVGASLSSCGYHTNGSSDLIPKSIRTIYVRAFQNLSIRYRLIDLLPQQIEREFVARGRFRIENDPQVADAILNGSVLSANIYPTIFDPTTGKATSVQVLVSIAYSFVERATGRILFTRSNLGFRQNYSIAVDPHQFFDEVGPALDRVGRDIARDVVSSVLENF